MREVSQRHLAESRLSMASRLNLAMRVQGRREEGRGEEEKRRKGRGREEREEEAKVTKRVHWNQKT